MNPLSLNFGSGKQPKRRRTAAPMQRQQPQQHMPQQHMPRHPEDLFRPAEDLFRFPIPSFLADNVPEQEEDHNFADYDAWHARNAAEAAAPYAPYAAWATRQAEVQLGRLR
ncbi:hypothetical protein TSOC_003492 [Tetrabaena socialis]|uniref:Uncharacterized protein n=1 Tax=Tetrabaena socialis TaxID=47790 RepID=A0A2J8ABE8_9CHLO|nr:hypothetical protein TSOC_012709 [Tetrabaena socialis]PNH09852.1 hypothetical protein TSOC_003492 [Tetrabaena socialis]|eukprot:PNH01412.1 hypothetical protein TSOC_012709 [Tetrabaena socialis]